MFLKVKVLVFVLVAILANVFFVSGKKVALNGVFEIDDSVYVLNRTNIQHFFDNNELVVVFFYAPWCGHCKQMKPYYHKAAAIFEADQTMKKKPLFAKVDCDADKSLREKYQIPGYPTLKIFRKGVATKYEGPRGDEKAIVNYMNKQLNWVKPKSYVKTLTNETFNEWAMSQELAFVAIYDEKECELCEMFDPNIEKAATTMKSSVPFARIFTDLESELAVKYNVREFPHLIIFNTKKPQLYKGGREANEIVRYMSKIGSSSSEEVDSYLRLKNKLTRKSDIYMLGLFDNKSQNLFETFSAFKVKHSLNVELFHTFNPTDFLNALNKQNHASSYEIKSPSIVIFYHDDVITYDKKQFKHFNNEDPSLEELEDFVFRTAIPKLGYLSPINRELIYENIHPICYIFFDKDVEVRKHFLHIRDSANKLTEEFMGIQFVIANETENQDAVFKFRLHVDDYSEITPVCVNDKGFFRFEEIEQTLMLDKIIEFIHKFQSNDLVPNIRSDSIYDKPSGTHVTKIIGLTFEEFMDTDNQDLVIGFYRRTDDDQSLFNAYFNLAGMLGITDKTLKFGKIDIINNDYPPMFDVYEEGSTVFYVPGNDKRNPIKYTGVFTGDGIKKFVLETQYELEKKKENAEKADKDTTEKLKEEKTEL